MAITYAWTFPALDTTPSADGLTNVVTVVHWTMVADDGAGHTSSAYGTCSVPYDPSEPFTPFQYLTKEEVTSWVVAQLGEEQVANIEASLATSIANQITPPVVQLPPPWG
jgi:hypothetical protein